MDDKVLLTELYELLMMQSYHALGMQDPATGVCSLHASSPAHLHSLIHVK